MVPTYQVSYRGRSVLLASRLLVKMVNGPDLGANVAVESSKTREIDETYRQFPGKRSKVVNRCQETTVRFREAGDPARLWEVDLRAYDDGAALRYRFLRKTGGNRWRSRTKSRSSGCQRTPRRMRCR